MLEFITQELENLKNSGLYRELKTIEKVDGAKITTSGKEFINFCSNDYLGLSQHPKVKAAAKEAIGAFGTGSGASRLISGNSILHAELERKIAHFKEREAAIVFPTGYMANLGTISTLVDENDTIIIDRLCHASIVDGCRLSKAKLQVYPHNDMNALEKILKKTNQYRKRLIITDSVFSMDGDIAPVKEIIRLGKKYDAITMADDAHATGVIEYDGKPDIVMGTLSKALGSLGGFIAGSTELIEYLRNKARSFIFTTALPPAACAAAIAALEIVEQQPELLGKLQSNITTINNKSKTPIIPILIGDAKRTMDISQELFSRGLFVSGIRPPTVPKNECRLRLTVTAAHSKEDLECLASSLRELIPA